MGSVNKKAPCLAAAKKTWDFYKFSHFRSTLSTARAIRLSI